MSLKNEPVSVEIESCATSYEQGTFRVAWRTGFSFATSTGACAPAPRVLAGREATARACSCGGDDGRRCAQNRSTEATFANTFAPGAEESSVLTTYWSESTLSL